MEHLLGISTSEVINLKIKELSTRYHEKMLEIAANYEKQNASIEGFRDAVHDLEEIIENSINAINKSVELEMKKIENEKKFQDTVMISATILCMMVVSLILVFYFKMASAISDIIVNLKGTSKSTFDSSTELKSTADDLSSTVSEQSAAVLETVSTLDEIREMMKRSVDNAEFSENKSNESHSVATEGKEAVSEVVNAIHEISDCNDDITKQMEKTSSELEQIVNVIKEISDKTKVINDIVFQTKLLSFNASVEAARAGEHGKGFAVVAEEVGNLAQMSGNASKQIEELITSSVNRVELIVSDSKNAVGRLVSVAKGKTEYGVETATKCNKVLDEVVANVAQVKDLMKEISGAASEQATGVENISTAMSQLDQTTHVNTSIAGQTAMSSSSLAMQASELDNIVNSLEKLINGNKKTVVFESSDENSNLDDRSNVVEIKKKADTKSNPAKMAAGESFSNMIPDGDDDRFEDI